MRVKKTNILIAALGTVLLIAGCQQGANETALNSADTVESGSTGETVLPDMDNTASSLQKRGWYLRTVAKATTADGKTYTHQTAGVFGELDDSSDAKDRHDIPSLGKATLQVRFLNDNIQKGREFFSDYRAYGEENGKEVWTFIVKNETGADLSQASLRIEVKDLIEVLTKEGESGFIESPSHDTTWKQKLTLVDVDNHQAYGVDELAHLTLGMDGQKVRTFRWVYNGDVDESDYTPLTTQTNPESRAVLRQSAQAATKDTFGLPPEE